MEWNNNRTRPTSEARMNQMRFTIGGLILVVGVVAVALAAIRSGSPTWLGAMLSITFFAMICSFLGIALGRAMRRVYWSGFALLGWSYLLLVFTPWIDEHVGQFVLAPHLFDYIEEVIQSSTPPPAPVPATPGGIGGGMRSVPVEPGGFDPGPTNAATSSEYHRIGTALEALLWAYLGGWVACYFASGRAEERGSRANAPTRAAGEGAQTSQGVDRAREPTSA